MGPRGEGFGRAESCAEASLVGAPGAFPGPQSVRRQAQGSGGAVDHGAGAAFEHCAPADPVLAPQPRAAVSASGWWAARGGGGSPVEAQKGCAGVGLQGCAPGGWDRGAQGQACWRSATAGSRAGRAADAAEALTNASAPAESTRG
jgi:hypothetical protein